MQSNQIRFETGLLHYKIYGSGENPLLAFHGFGQSAAYFETFGEQLGDYYTIYAFDIFFHGDSQWNDEKNPLSKSLLKKYIEQLLTDHAIDKFAVCGYSMGGKFALSCVELFPELLTQCILIAPDGIKTSFWYSLATYPQFFRSLFRKTINNPRTFQDITLWANRLGLVDKSILKFARGQMNTEQNRRRVYMSWVIFRLLFFDLQKLAKILNHKQIPVLMITGSYDRIITSDNMMKLLKHLDVYQNIVLETGHNKLIAESAAFLSKNKNELIFREI